MFMCVRSECVSGVWIYTCVCVCVCVGQVFADRKRDPEGFELHKTLRRGDLIGVKGNPGRTK
jgi:hypothetical protein